MLQRLAPHRISTDLPLDLVREACWHVLVELRFGNVLIDREKDLVSGSRGNGFISRDETAILWFRPEAQNTVIEVKTQSIFGGPTLITPRRRARKIADAVQFALSAPQLPLLSQGPPRVVAPIAEPTGESSYLKSSPRYGPFVPVKRGALVLVYGVLGLTLVHIVAPMAWIYANRTLTSYSEVDPGDRKLVIIGRILAAMGTVIFLGFWLVFVWGNYS